MREKRELLATVIDESERLNRFIANLLDMTKLESGADRAEHRAARPRRDRRQRAAARRQDPRRITRSSWSSPPTCRCCELDAVLFEQVLFNLLDNAAKYAPAGHHDHRSAAARDRDAILLQVLDEGDGIPPADLEQNLRQVLSRAEGRSGARRHRPWPCDLARLRRGDARHDLGRQPHRPQRRRVHHQAADARRSQTSLDTAA